MARDLQPMLEKHISKFAFGVMQFGGKADRAASRDLYDQARAAGITLFDAAFAYCDGASEELLGEFAESEQDKVVLISKCMNIKRRDVEELREQVHASRQRLRVETLEILYLHRYPGDDLLDAALGLMGELHAEGAFKVLGVSNFAAWQVMKAQARAAALGAPRIEILQPMYSLVKRQAEVEILPMAIGEDLAVHSYSPLGGGLLTGKYAKGETGRITHDQMYAKRYEQGWMHDAAVGLGDLAAEVGIPAPALAVAWVAHHKGITAPILSASRPEQLAPSLAAAEVDMTDELYARLSALTPTPPPATDRTEEA